MATSSSQIGDEAIIKATGNSWTHWMKVLSDMDAKSLPHKDIARKLYEEHNVPGWWCQMLTVKYEQEIGRRKPGDSKNGATANVSMTVVGRLDHVYRQWQEAFKDSSAINKEPIVEPPSISQTEDWRYWKVKFQDGSRAYVNISQKSEDKVMLQITHERVASETQADQWRTYWKSKLEELFAD